MTGNYLERGKSSWSCSFVDFRLDGRNAVDATALLGRLDRGGSAECFAGAGGSDARVHVPFSWGPLFAVSGRSAPRTKHR